MLRLEDAFHRRNYKLGKIHDIHIAQKKRHVAYVGKTSDIILFWRCFILDKPNYY
jgi:hypothetical protein